MGRIIVGLVLLLGGPLLIYFWLAPQNKWFTFTKEGTAKMVVRGDAFIGALIQWKDRTFQGPEKGIVDDDEWEVVEGGKPQRFGGLRLFSLFYPLDRIYSYRHRWTHLHEDGEVVTHDERLDFVFLKEDLYVIEVPLTEEGGAEDLNGVPLGIKIALPMRIINPYIAVFRVGRWLPMITGIVQARFRRFVADYRYKEDLLNMRAGKDIEDVQAKAGISGDVESKDGKDLWERFWQKVEKDFKIEGGQVEDQKAKRVIKIYGVEINEKGARILDINPLPRYREFTTMEYEASQKKRRTEIEAETRAAETIGTIIQMMAISRGKEVEEITEEINSNAQTQEEFLKVSKDLMVRKMGIEGSAYLDIRVAGNDGEQIGGFERVILNALAAWQRMPQGSQSIPEASKVEEKTDSRSSKPTNEEEEWEEMEREMEKLTAEADAEAKRLGTE